MKRGSPWDNNGCKGSNREPCDECLQGTQSTQGVSMAIAAHRWLMTAPKAPMIREAFDPFPPGAGEVVVEVAGCGVCHTALGYFYDGVRTNHALPLVRGPVITGRV